MMEVVAMVVAMAESTVVVEVTMAAVVAAAAMAEMEGKVEMEVKVEMLIGWVFMSADPVAPFGCEPAVKRLWQEHPPWAPL